MKYPGAKNEISIESTRYPCENCNEISWRKEWNIYWKHQVSIWKAQWNLHYVISLNLSIIHIALQADVWFLSQKWSPLIEVDLRCFGVERASLVGDSKKDHLQERPLRIGNRAAKNIPMVSELRVGSSSRLGSGSKRSSAAMCPQTCTATITSTIECGYIGWFMLGGISSSLYIWKWG